jgi:hypothetical protein
MAMLRFLSVVICAVLLTGCPSLERDVDKFKRYLRAIPPPSECKEPGVAQARICYYKLEIKAIDKAHGLYKGHVTKDVVEQGVKDCEAAKAKVVEDYRYEAKDYDCPHAEYYNFVWYGFKIEGSTPNDGVVELINIANTNSLREGTAAEALIDPYGKRTQPHAR